MLEVKNLSKIYRTDLFGKKAFCAVDHVSFSVKEGETLGIIGESGCGKSTIAKMLSLLLKPTSGSVLLDGKECVGLKGKEAKQYHKEVQIMFQNPETALDPNKKIEACILEAIRNYHLVPKRSQEEKELLNELIHKVGLLPEHLDRYSWELSGGQIQRAVLARVISLSPKVLISDEPTSMLDVSVQAQILNLIKELQKTLNFSMIFVSHDLDVVRAVSDQILVMNHGKIVEKGTVQEVFEQPREAYTKALLHAFYYDEPNNKGGDEKCC